jgi:hypothetical protein
VICPPEKRVLDAALRQTDQLVGDPNHTVAAAAMDTLGRIYTAANEYHFTGGPCAYAVPEVAPARFIRFNPRYYDDVVVVGRKTATTRYDDPCVVGPAWLVIEFDDEYKRLPGVVDSIDSKRFDQISDDDARLEGAGLAVHLRSGLRHHYPTIQDDSHPRRYLPRPRERVNCREGATDRRS